MSESAEHEHEFLETYYGYECQSCGQFYAFGCAPWEEDPYIERDKSEVSDV